MRSQRLKLALACSLALNLGFVGVVAVRSYRAAVVISESSRASDLTARLALDSHQREQWMEAERKFLADLDADAAALRSHRERLIRHVFSDPPDAVAIESERAAIARLQQKQQHRVIAQLLEERALLRAEQRTKLETLLLQQPAAAGPEALHRK